MKIKRGQRKQKETFLNIFSTNAAGLKPKMESLKQELKFLEVGIFTIQETHCSSKGKVKIDNFETFEAIRKGKQKGGTIIGVHKALKPVLIQEYNETFELLVVEINIADIIINLKVHQTEISTKIEN